MKKIYRYMTSLLLTIIYLVIVSSPLMPLVMRSETLAHAFNNECSGDCRIDGCSLERSAAHACCCWQKKSTGRTASNGSGSKFPSSTTPVKMVSCCIPPPEPPKKIASCCATKSNGTEEEGGITEAVSAPPVAEKRQTSISSKPCGSDKLYVLLSVESTQHLPYYFTGEGSSPEHGILIPTFPVSLTSRHLEPPDPPPIIS